MYQPSITYTVTQYLHYRQSVQYLYCYAISILDSPQRLLYYQNYVAQVLSVLSIVPYLY